MCTAIRILTYKDFATKEELEAFQIVRQHNITVIRLDTVQQESESKQTNGARLIYERYVTNEEFEIFKKNIK